jgi:Flp pilus assembly protein CpaB
VKQKNVVLVVVAAACGLAAAVLTTQMTGKPAAPDQVEILVAAKDLPVNTKLEREKLGELIKKKKVLKTEVPQEGAFFSEEELVDKYLTRPRGANDTIFLTDVSPHKAGLTPPPGKHLCTVKLPYENVGPFIEPGSKVDMFVTVQRQEWRQARQFPLLTKVLVMAVDTGYSPGAGGQQQQQRDGRAAINTVTIAATPGESKWLDIAKKLGGDIKLLVRGEDSPDVRQLKDDELAHLFNDPDVSTNPGEDLGKKGKVVKLAVPRAFLSAGTEVTEDVIKDKFREKEFDENDAPKDAVADIYEYLGKFLVKDAERGEPLGKDAFGDKPAAKDPVTPVTPVPQGTSPTDVAKGDGSKPPRTEMAPRPRKVERKPIDVWEPVIVSPRGAEKHRYEKFDEKEGWIYRGVVGKDGVAVPGPAPELNPDARPNKDGGK